MIGHSHFIAYPVVLPNGNLFSGSWDYTMQIWNSTSFEFIATLIGHINSVHSLTILINGTLLPNGN